MDLEVKGFIETSFVDWDGHIVSVLFLPYCNFKCPFCHNAGLVENSQNYQTIPLDKIEKFLLSHKDFIDGVCITGGEPCLHHDKGLLPFLTKIKGFGFKVKFDTNGNLPEFLKELIDNKDVDFIAMDIKGPLDKRYDKLSGVETDLEKVKKSIKMIMDSGIPYEFRTTVVPNLLNAEDVIDIAKFISGSKKFVIQQFISQNSWDASLREIKPYQKEELEAIASECKKFVPNTILRGV